MRFAFIVFLFIVFVAAKPGYVEYYKYTDENGVVRFTDDLGSVPGNMREKVESFEEIKSPSGQQGYQGQKDHWPDTDNGNDAKTSSSVTNDEMRQKAEKILKERASLEERFEALEQEKKELEDLYRESEGKKASEEYINRVEELNDKISRYEQDREAFEKKVKNFRNDGNAE